MTDGFGWWIVFLALAAACFAIGLLISQKEHHKRMEEEQRTLTETRELRQEADKRKRRQEELEDLEFQLQAAKKRKELQATENPPPLRKPDEEKFDDYQFRRAFDVRQELFEAVFLPAMTAIELEKAFDKQKTEIDRDSTLTESQKDRLGKILRQNYRKAADQVKGRTSSIYDDDP